jgi:hypothetical protein
MSFLQSSSPKSCKHCFSNPYVPRAKLNRLSLFNSEEKKKKKNKRVEVKILKINSGTWL